MLLAFLVVFTIFGAQLLRIQGLDASATQALAAARRQGEVIIPAVRGRILDSSGNVLAASYERRDVTADQTVVAQYHPSGPLSGVAAAAPQLAPLLGQTVAEVTKTLTGTMRYVVVARGVTPQVWQEIENLGINGIYSEPASTRVYPDGASTAALVGITHTSDGTGASGLELMENSVLSGSPGKKVYQQTRYGAPIAGTEKVDIPAVDGSDVKTTIDSDLQYVAEQAIAAEVTKTKAQAGYVVVEDVATGHLLAVASAPTFDPTNAGSVPISALGDRAFQEVYEPGSTGKLLTAAAALQEGLVTPTTPVIVPNRLHRSTEYFADDINHPTWDLTFAGVLARSSNIGTMMVGEQMTPTTIESYFRKFGIGEPTGIGFPGESRGILTPAPDLNGTQRYTMLFGQGYSVTAIQVASIYQTIANGGVRIPPTLVEGTVAPDGAFAPAPEPAASRVVSTQTASMLTSMLEEVVGPGGTAPNAAIPGYRVAGKTGTANRYDQALKKYSGYTASFIGYAPADHPRFVVAVTLQAPVNGHFGSQVAAPVFKQVMEYALAANAVPPSTSAAPRVPLTDPQAATDPRAIRP